MGILETPINELSYKNSTITPLEANATFIGEIENILAFSSLQLNIYSDTDSSINGIKIICSQDKDFLTGIYIETDTYYTTNEYHRFIALKGKYMRLEYTNSNNLQTILKIQTIKSNHLSENNDNNIINLDFTSVNSNLTVINTSINNLESNINANLTIINDSLISGITVNTKQLETQLDAFGRLRISNPITIFENNNIYSKDSEYIDELVIGNNANITYQLSNSAVILSTLNNNDNVIRQSHQYLNYQPGKSLLIYASGVLNPNSLNESNVSTYIGYFDDENGVFFKHNNNNLYVGIRSNTSGTIMNNEIIQSQWNIDTMDGTGISGITIDPSKTQIFYIDIEWLGVGTVRTGFIIDGNYYLVHKFHHANTRNNVYMTTPNLPLRYQIKSLGDNNTKGSLMEICGTVISEGGFEPIGIIQTLIRDTLINIAKNDGEVALLALRLKDSYKRAYNRISEIQVLVSNQSNDRVIYRLKLFKNVSNISTLFVSGGTFNNINNNSIMEATVNPVFASNALTTLEFRNIYQGFAVSRLPELGNHYRGLFLASNIVGVRDIIVLTVYTLNNNTDVFGSINWIEHN